MGNVERSRAARQNAHAPECCRFTTYRHRFARAAPAPRAKRNDDSKNRGRASPVNPECRDVKQGLHGSIRRFPPIVAKQQKNQARSPGKKDLVLEHEQLIGINF